MGVRWLLVGGHAVAFNKRQCPVPKAEPVPAFAQETAPQFYCALLSCTVPVCAANTSPTK